MTDLDTRIRVSFDAQTMMQTPGASLVEVTPGHCVIEAPILPEVKQQHGFGHAALTFAIGDTAAGYAALSMMDPEQEVLTAEIKINLLAPARGDKLIARGEVVKFGRRLVIVSARVAAEENGKLTEIALLQGTMTPV
ncbi:MAG: PaaI family thioesterase [Rhodobacteraceae bacterium]|nr:PaaI family thioesterase [Paracoccaceae bacterium]